jgi:hypothetical protein
MCVVGGGFDEGGGRQSHSEYVTFGLQSLEADSIETTSYPTNQYFS